MPSTYSSRLRFELIGSGEQSGTWGTTTNTNLGTLIEQAIAGVAAVAMTDANYTLVASNGASDEARCAVLQVTGTLTAARDVTCPTASKLYLVYNNTTGGFAITIKTAAGTGISVANGKKMFVYCDGTNVVDAMNNLPSGTQVGGSDIVTLSASQTLTNKVLTSPTINTGTLSSPTVTGTLTCADNVFQLQDNGDNTKKLAFELSGITTGNTRTLTIPNASDTIVGLAATQTLTNKTLDATNTITAKDSTFTITDDATPSKVAAFQCSTISAATTRTFTFPDASGTLLLSTGSGTSLTGIRIQGKETIYVPAGAMIPNTTNGSVLGSQELTTNKIMVQSQDFADGATTLSCQFAIRMPKSWNAGTVTASFVWTANSTSTNSVVWQCNAMALGDNETIDTAFGTAQTVTDANTATANQVHLSAETSAITIGSSPASQNLVYFKVFRDPTNGSDTLAATANLLGVNIYYTTNASDDT